MSGVRGAAGALAVVLAALGGCSDSGRRDERSGARTEALTVSAPELVKDIQTGPLASPLPKGGAPDFLQVVGGAVFYSYDDGVHGRELWRTDGTPEGTWLVKDVQPGAGASTPSGLVAVGDTLYFAATESDLGTRLWRTDDTPGGTRPVMGARGGGGFTSPMPLGTWGGVLLFFAEDAEAGRELWRTDGTPEGTWRVKDMHPGPDGSAFSTQQRPVATSRALFFIADDGFSGAEVWRTDGTEAGTFRVSETQPGAGSGGPLGMRAAGELVFFSADDGTSGREPWRTDGTPEGTWRLKDVLPGAAGSAPRFLGALGEVMFFAANDGEAGEEPWRTDGTLEGTWRVKDIRSGGTSSSIAYPLVWNGALYFMASDSVAGQDLWRTDGTEAGTQRVADLKLYLGLPPVGPGAGTSEAFYFWLPEGSFGGSLWKSDGTAAGTVPVRYMEPASKVFLTKMVVLGDLLVFSGDDNSSLDSIDGQDLWVSDGTKDGTHLARRRDPVGSRPSQLMGTEGSLFFLATTSATGNELWFSDGTEAGTRLTHDLYTDIYHYPGAMALVGKTLFFRGWDAAAGYELWKSDGTEAGTARVADLAPGTDDSIASSTSVMVDLGGTLLFECATPETGLELCRSDGTPEGTGVVKDIVPGTDGLGAKGMVAWNGAVWFVGNDYTSGQELWKSDGTEAGTVRVADLVPGSGSSNPTPLRGLGDAFYFSATDAQGVRALWRTDGTEAGTVRMPVPVATTSGPQVAWAGNRLYVLADGGVWRTDGTEAGTVRLGADRFTSASFSQVVGGLVLFWASDAAGFGWWRTDGTEEGTFRLDGGLRSSAVDSAVVNDTLFFRASDAAHGYELWRTDGTLEGTRLVKDVLPGPKGGMVGSLVNRSLYQYNNPLLALPAEGLLLFLASDGVHGVEPWVTDGTEEGTRMLADLSPGEARTPVGEVRRSGDSLFFTADDGVHGMELWRMPVPVPSVDSAPPEVKCPASLTVEAEGPSGARVTYPPASATDESTWRTEVTYSHASGSLFPPEDTAVTVTAKDRAGNTSTCTFHVTVRPVAPLAMTCPASVTAEAAGPQGASVMYPPATVSDERAPDATVTYSPESGAVFPLGETGVTATASDAAGYTGACSFSVFVRDTTPPELTCPADVTTPASGPEGRVVELPLATAQDAVTASPEVTYSPSSGCVFFPGTTRVTVTAFDEAGNLAECTFGVTVPSAPASEDGGAAADGGADSEDGGSVPVDGGLEAPDAGGPLVEDGGASLPDAGGPLPDGGTPDAGVGPSTAPDGSGCGCAAGVGSGSTGWGALLLLGWVVARRRAASF